MGGVLAKPLNEDNSTQHPILTGAVLGRLSSILSYGTNNGSIRSENILTEENGSHLQALVCKKKMENNHSFTLSERCESEYADFVFYTLYSMQQQSKALKCFVRLQIMFDQQIRSAVSTVVNDPTMLSRLDVRTIHAELFARKIQMTNDSDVKLYLHCAKQVACEIHGTPVDSKDYAQIQDAIKQALVHYSSKTSINSDPLFRVQLYHTDVAVKYYLQEQAVNAPPGTVICYDPLYSVPNGVLPSCVLKLRLKKWMTVDEAVRCRCDFQMFLALWMDKVKDQSVTNTTTIASTYSQKHPANPAISDKQNNSEECIVVLPMFTTEDLLCLQELCKENPHLADCSKLMSSTFFGTIHKLKYCTSCDIWSTLKSLCLQNSSKEGILVSLSSFAMCLITSKFSSIADYIQLTVEYVMNLLDNNLPQLVIPILGTVLQISFSDAKIEIYKLLADAIAKLLQLTPPMTLEKWFLDATLDFITTMLLENSIISSLPDMLLSYSKLFGHLLKVKTSELIQRAVASIDAVPNSCVSRSILTELLKLYESYQPSDDLTDDIKGALDIISGVLIISRHGHNVKSGLNKIMRGVWQNPTLELCTAAAKVLSLLDVRENVLCQLKNRHDITGLSIQLSIPDHNLLLQEMEIEESVTKGRMTFTDAALWYIDLMATNPTSCAHQRVICLIKAALCFQNDFKAASPVNEKIALRNAALTCAYDACQLALVELQPGFRLLIFHLAFEITHCLATAGSTLPIKHCSDALLAGGMLKHKAYNYQFTFLSCFPRDKLYVAYSHYFNKVSSAAQQAYINTLKTLDEHVLPIRSALLHYHCFENVLHCDLMLTAPCFDDLRKTVLSKFLSEMNWTMEDVSKRMKSPLMPRDHNGWLVYQKTLSDELEIAELKGFCFANGSIKILYEPAKDGNGVLSFSDIFTVLHLNSDEIFPISFSLDPPSVTERFHPYHQLVFHPKKIKNTNYMETLFQADYLLKFICTKSEVSANPPFEIRSLEHLLKSLPKHLQHVMRPPYVRGRSDIPHHRSWIEIEEVQYDEEISEGQASYYFQDVKVAIRRRSLIQGIRGKSHDTVHSENIDGPDSQFANDLTKHYKEISKHFRIFARVPELAKLQFFMQKVYNHLQSLKSNSPSDYQAFHTELNRLRSLHPVKQVNDTSSCNWVPATYMRFENQPAFVYGGVLFSDTNGYLKTNAYNRLSSSGELVWTDAYANHIVPVNSLDMPGGVYFGINQHYRVPIYVRELDSIVCVTLGSGNAPAASHGEKGICHPQKCQTESSLNQTESQVSNTHDHKQEAVPEPFPSVASSNENESLPSDPFPSETVNKNVSPQSVFPLAGINSEENSIVLNEKHESAAEDESQSVINISDPLSLKGPVGDRTELNSNLCSHESNGGVQDTSTLRVPNSHDGNIDTESTALKNETSVLCECEEVDESQYISLFSHFCQCPLNLAVFGKAIENAGINIANLPVSQNDSIEQELASIHSSKFVQEQIKNVIILRHILQGQGDLSGSVQAQ